MMDRREGYIQRSNSTGDTIGRDVATNNSNTNYIGNENSNTNSPVPFKTLGTTRDCRNHVMPLNHLQQHNSSKAGKRRSLSIISDHTTTSSTVITPSSSEHTINGANNMNDDKLVNSNHSNLNFSYQSDLQQQDGQQHGRDCDNATTTTTMPNEQESYDAAANGILAPWSARVASLFGDMMKQSNQNDKTKKAFRKKPNNKRKRPSSA